MENKKYKTGKLREKRRMRRGEMVQKGRGKQKRLEAVEVLLQVRTSEEKGASGIKGFKCGLEWKS